MHPRVFAERTPDKPAYILEPGGVSVTYAELEKAANQGAHLFQSLGCKRGDVVALFLENHEQFFKIVWAAQRAGLYLVSISSKLLPDEIGYILENSGAKVLISSVQLSGQATRAAAAHSGLKCFLVDGVNERFAHYQEAISKFPCTPSPSESLGEIMLYSSGTTGRPKGIKPSLPDEDQPVVSHSPAAQGFAQLFEADEHAVYLSPAPLYHAAPLNSCLSVHRLGGTVIVMESFDAEAALGLIDKHRVTCSQWVPTHFVRMLKLEEGVRKKFDLSSMRKAVHAAAPCPIPIKRQMIDWWGPIIDEYYAGSEGMGSTFISASEWLDRPGSVGRAFPPSQIHICDDDGQELPPGEVGTIYFSGGRDFVYHDDPEKTRAARSSQGWSTLGDVGKVDNEGYLYLSDRKDFMIISGGVNIYPQEIENELIAHADIMDAAVFGLPDPEMGERVVAVIELIDPEMAGEKCAADIVRYLRSRLSHVKTPGQIDFTEKLPRTPTGKLMKGRLRDAYLKER